MPRNKSRAINRDGRRAIFVVAILGTLFGAATLIGLHPNLLGTMLPAKAIASDQQSGDAIQVGSILFVPYAGNKCRQNMLDNRTGAIWTVGIVPCDEALAQATTGEAKQWSVARMEALRGSFRR